MKELLVIASYPPKGEIHGRPTVGVASYTKHTLRSLEPNVAITVLAEQLPNEKTSYQEGNINIVRLWRRNSLLTFPRILFVLLTKHQNTSNILLPFELAMFGGALSLIPFVLFLIILRLLGKKVNVVCHQVIIDTRELAGHINMQKNDPRLLFLNMLAQLFYSIVLFVSHKIIVFEDFLKTILSQFGDSNKITVIFHGVEEFTNTATKNDARKRLSLEKDKFVVLYFGYLAWYKGIDWLVQNWKNQSNVSLIIAGGSNPNHLDKAYYRKYISTIEEICKEKNIKLTGFVPQEQIPLYFQAADITIFPYRTVMSSSGPLSMAFSFEKPFLISEALVPLFEKQDIKGFTFSLDDNMAEKIDAFQHNSSLSQKAIKVSTRLKKERSWQNIGKLYYEELFSQ